MRNKTFSNKIFTALRRIFLPGIKLNYFIIDIGCGGNPNPRANVVCDYFTSNSERAKKLKIDRPFVWANIENLPFKNKTFDYSVLSHVLEHLYNPQKAISELERVSKAGYIETPNAFYEYIIPHTYHVSRCTVINKKLIISFKNKWNETFIDKNYSDVKHDMMRNWWDLNHYDSRSLLTRYYWKNKIHYKINGNSSKFKKNLKYEKNSEFKEIPLGLIRKKLIKLIYAVLRPRKKVDFSKILVCPKCLGPLDLKKINNQAFCTKCYSKYPKFQGYYDFRLEKIKR